MTISERISKIIEVWKITKTDFANTLNVTPAYISKIINKGATPSDRLMEDICEKFNINEEWLRTGNGEMFLEQNRKDKIMSLAKRLMQNEPEEFVDRLATAMSKLDICDWEVLADVAESLVRRKKD